MDVGFIGQPDLPSDESTNLCSVDSESKKINMNRENI